MSDDIDPLCFLKERVAALSAGPRVGSAPARNTRQRRADPMLLRRDHDGT